MMNFVLGILVGSILGVGVLVLLQAGKEYENTLEK